MARRARRVSVIVCACLFLIMTVGGTAFAAGVGIHPRIDGADHSKITPAPSVQTPGCTNIKVHADHFTPGTLAHFFVIATTEHNPGGGVVDLPVDGHGRTSGVLSVCGLTVSPDVIEYTAQDLSSGYYSNTAYTTAK